MAEWQRDDYAKALGRLIANFHFLEFALRASLYLADTPPAERMPKSVRLAALRPGDSLPLSHLSSYDSLRELIRKYNAHQTARGGTPEVDEGFADLRDTIAHGRVLSDQLDGAPVAVKFERPAKGRDAVHVEFAVELTIERLREKSGAVAEAATSVFSRVQLLGVGTPE